jgi:signal transduction histidine kinase
MSRPRVAAFRAQRYSPKVDERLTPARKDQQSPSAISDSRLNYVDTSVFPPTHMAFLLEASRMLSQTLEYRQVLQYITDLIVPYMADIGVIDILEGPDVLRRVAVTHVEPHKAGLMHQMMARYPPLASQRHPIWQAVWTGKVLHLEAISSEVVERYAQDAEHLRLLKAIGPHSASLVVPLQARGTTQGVMSLGLIDGQTRFSPADMELAIELGRRAALAIDNARLYEQAEAAIHARNQFIGLTVHELKTPLTALLGYAMLLQRSEVLTTHGTALEHRAIDTVVAQAHRLNTMVGELLDIKQFETKQVHLHPTPIDVCALARRVLEAHQLTTTGQHRLVYDGAEQIRIEADEARLTQALSNLLNNAIKYSPNGGTIRLRVAQHGSDVVVSVSDQGIGISDDQIARIFDHLYRAPTAKAQPIKGLGIGLYLVKEIVSMHGGRIEVSSCLNQGTTFTIYLPVASRTAAHGS